MEAKTASRDRDPQQRIWLSLGYGGKRGSSFAWRYWKKPKTDRAWIISAPNGLAEFEQYDKVVFYNGEKIVAARTQWLATWGALAYFYEKLIHRLPAPPSRS